MDVENQLLPYQEVQTQVNNARVTVKDNLNQILDIKESIAAIANSTQNQLLLQYSQQLDQAEKIIDTFVEAEKQTLNQLIDVARGEQVALENAQLALENARSVNIVTENQSTFSLENQRQAEERVFEATLREQNANSQRDLALIRAQSAAAEKENLERELTLLNEARQREKEAAAEEGRRLLSRVNELEQGLVVTQQIPQLQKDYAKLQRQLQVVQEERQQALDREKSERLERERLANQVKNNIVAYQQLQLDYKQTIQECQNTNNAQREANERIAAAETAAREEETRRIAALQAKLNEERQTTAQVQNNLRLQITYVEEDLEENKRKLDNYEEDLRRATAEAERLRGDLEQAYQTNQLNILAERLKAQEIADTNQRLSDQLVVLEQERARLREQQPTLLLEGAERDREQRQQIVALNDQVSEKDASLRRLETQIANLKDSESRTIQARAAAEERARQAEQNRTLALTEQSKLQSLLDAEKKKLAATDREQKTLRESEASKFQSQATEQTRQIQTLQSQLKKAKDDVDAAVREQSRIGRDKDEEVRRLNALLQSLQREARLLQDQNLNEATIRLQLATAQTQLESQKSELDRLRQEKEASQKQLVIQQQETSKQRTIGVNEEILIAELREQNRRLTSANLLCSTNLGSIEKQVDSLQFYRLSLDGTQLERAENLTLRGGTVREVLVVDQRIRDTLNTALVTQKRYTKIPIYIDKVFRRFPPIDDPNVTRNYVLLREDDLQELIKQYGRPGQPVALIPRGGGGGPLVGLGVAIGQTNVLNHLEMSNQQDWHALARNSMESRPSQYTMQVHFTTGRPDLALVDQLHFEAVNVPLVDNGKQRAYVLDLTSSPPRIPINAGTLVRDGIYGQGFVALAVNDRSDNNKLLKESIVDYRFKEEAGRQYNTRVSLHITDKLTFYARYTNNNTYILEMILVEE
jgi:hypothetical protein